MNDGRMVMIVMVEVMILMVEVIMMVSIMSKVMVMITMMMMSIVMVMNSRTHINREHSFCSYLPSLIFLNNLR